MQDVAQELESILDIADRLLAIPEEVAAHKPGPDKWSIKETLGHLVDSAANNHQRFVRLQLQNHLELPGYEQDGWVRVQRYQDFSWNRLIALWTIYNQYLAHLIRNVNPDALKHTWNGQDGKTLTLEFIMRDYLVHMQHHLDQIV